MSGAYTGISSHGTCHVPCPYKAVGDETLDLDQDIFGAHCEHRYA